jgi:hypothetical protein
LTVMLDGFPLDKQSIEHVCLSNSSLDSASQAIHSEAALRCGVVAGMKETNAGFARLFETPGVGDDLNTIAAGEICLTCDGGEEPTTIYTTLSACADRKALENMRGCGPCSPWCVHCDRAVQHLLPWPRGAHPPTTMVEFRRKKSQLIQVDRPGGGRQWKGCSAFFTNALMREAGHGAQKGEELPGYCRYCDRVPYASVAERDAAKARLLRLKVSPSKKDRATHDRERSAYALKHARQHEFSYMWLDLGVSAPQPHGKLMQAGAEVWVLLSTPTLSCWSLILCSQICPLSHSGLSFCVRRYGRCGTRVPSRPRPE